MENNKEYKIYTLADPRTPDNIRYVGATRVPLKERLFRHISDSKYHKNNRYIFNFINSLTKNNLKPHIELLEVCAIDNWDESEIYWINQFRAWGFKLTNTAPGGKIGGVIKHSEETKNKIREALKNKPPEWHAKNRASIMKAVTGRKKTDEEKRAISIKSLGHTLSAESKLKISLKNKGKNNGNYGKSISNDIKLKIKKQSLGRTISEETKKLKSKNCPHKREVFQIDKFTNKIVGEFESVTQASKLTNTNKIDISACCNNRQKTANNYIWKFKNEIKNFRIAKYAYILQYDLNGNFIEKFSTGKEVCNKFKIDNSTISKACNEQRYTAAGFIWRTYNGDGQIPLKIEVK